MITSESKGQDVGLEKQLSELQSSLELCRKEISSQWKEIQSLRSAQSSAQPVPLNFTTTPMTSAGHAAMQTVPSWSGWQVPNGSTAVAHASTEPEGLFRTTAPVGVTSSPPTGQGPPRTENRRQPGVENPCRICQDPTHWAKNCPSKRRTTGRDSGMRSSMNTLTANNRAADVYLHFVINKKRDSCLLDTGSETSVIGRRLVPDLVLQPTSQHLYAANGTEIPLLGEVAISFRLQGVPASANVVVAESVEDLILGIDWISENKCQWDFGRGVIRIHDNILRLHSRPHQGRVRRIYAERDTVIPAGHQGDVSVNVIWPNLRPAGSDLAVPPKPIQRGVICARTLLGGSAVQSAVHVINTSDKDCTIRKGTYVGPAEEVEVCNGAEVRKQNGDKSVEGMTCLTMKSQSEVESTDHVQPVIQSLPEDLPAGEKVEAMLFIRKHADLFFKSEFDIGRTPLVQHVIDTGHHRPFKQQLRRHPLSQLPVIDEHVEKMLANDIIQPAASPWASNVVLVRRKDNNFRFVLTIVL